MKGELKNKKNELDTVGGVIFRLNNQLKNAQSEVTNLRAKVEQLEKENTDLKNDKKQELDDAK